MSFVVAVTVVIARGDRVLAMRRAAHKDAGAGLWETPSGRVDADEQPETAALREVREETGLEIALHPRPVDAYVARRGEAPMLVLVYRADHVAGEVVTSIEHDDHEWLDVAGFAERTSLARLALAVERAMLTSA